MGDHVLVNFHIHSVFSDGVLTPEELVGKLAHDGVRYCALTDHDTLEGLPRFRSAVKKRGMAFLPGVELTTHFSGQEIHLLGYGFDPQNVNLSSTLRSIRQAYPLDVHSVSGSIRKAGSSQDQDSPIHNTGNSAPDGYLSTKEAIDLIHHAGGYAFLAHPLATEPDHEKLELIVSELNDLGLDGIEAIYPSFSETEQANLKKLAHIHDQMLCAGTDFHGINSVGGSFLGIQMPKEDWVRFRKAVINSHAFENHVHNHPSPTKDPKWDSAIDKPHHFRIRPFALRIFLPTLIAITLFLAAIWGIILPSFEQTLLDRKREMIRELTYSAWSVLESYHRDEQKGVLTREQAQEMAVARIQDIRYGSEGKDYFWLQDMQPKMIMHPYRPDLNGQELNNYKDPLGASIFVEFAALVAKKGEGYIDYVWQWKDDPDRLEPKESFVKGFSPWNWVIGTGIYIDDVNAEIARIKRNLINTSLLISGAVILLLMFVLQQSLLIEKKRQEVVEELHEASERYKSLLEATTEGTLLVVDGHCRYANATLLKILGYSARQLELLQLDDLLPNEVDNNPIRQSISKVLTEKVEVNTSFEGCLTRSDGLLLDCILAINPIRVAGRQGFILLVKEISRQPSSSRIEGMGLATQYASVGIFRAKAARRGVFLDINPAGWSMLPTLSRSDSTQTALEDLFPDISEFENMMNALLTEGQIENQNLYIEDLNGTVRIISLTARLIKNSDHEPSEIVGTMKDITTSQLHAMQLKDQIDSLQTTHNFLMEPVANLETQVVINTLDSSTEMLFNKMKEKNAKAALITDDTSTVIGIITRDFLRTHLSVNEINFLPSINNIMVNSMTRISGTSLIYEALMLMEEKGENYLAVEDTNGQVINVIDRESLTPFRHYGPIILTREISKASTPENIVLLSKKTPELIKPLIDNHAHPRSLTRMLSSICDAVTQRLIDLSFETLGPPPAPFAFIAMGSQGRQEQSLLTDQDNGIIYLLSPDHNPDQISGYFLKLGERVCAGLALAGYNLCRGNVMASNPRWCRSLTDWLSTFDQWIDKSEPQEIVDTSIFFDFRTVYGDFRITNDLRLYINDRLRNESAFFHHLSQNALVFKPPIRLVGNIYIGGGDTDHSGEINLKDAMMPLVSFARLYALRHQINQTHTLGRIETLTDKGLIITSSRDEISESYNYLMQLRLENQVLAIVNGYPPQNTINPGRLGRIQKELLKHAFAQIVAVQKKISYDFLGGV